MDTGPYEAVGLCDVTNIIAVIVLTWSDLGARNLALRIHRCALER